MKCKAAKIEFTKDCELKLSTQKHLHYKYLRTYHRLCNSPLTLTVSCGEAHVCVCLYMCTCLSTCMLWKRFNGICFSALLNLSYEDLDVQRQNLKMMNAWFKIILWIRSAVNVDKFRFMILNILFCRHIELHLNISKYVVEQTRVMFKIKGCAALSQRGHSGPGFLLSITGVSQWLLIHTAPMGQRGTRAPWHQKGSQHFTSQMQETQMLCSVTCS